MAAPRRSREIDRSAQRFHVGNEYGRLHGREFLGRTLIFTGYWQEELPKNSTRTSKLPSSNLCVISIGAVIFILKLNHADVIGDQSDTVTQNAWFRCGFVLPSLERYQY